MSRDTFFARKGSKTRVFSRHRSIEDPLGGGGTPPPFGTWPFREAFLALGVLGVFGVLGILGVLGVFR